VLLTGAAGLIGSSLRADWQGRFPTLRLTDVRDVGPAGPGEEVVHADLSDPDEAAEAVRGVDAIVHLAAIPDEDAFARLMPANIAATYNVLEAARLHGVKRVVFASTNHVTGFYPCSERISPADPQRPDSLYGATKAFGELLGRLYHDKFGLEVVCVRIASFTERPENPRALSTWFSPADASRLFVSALTAADVGFVVVYGVSKTARPYWENDEAAAAIGYVPEDDAEAFVELFGPDDVRTAPGCRQGAEYTRPTYHGADPS
jgi:uronate dehydrogenase